MYSAAYTPNTKRPLTVRLEIRDNRTKHGYARHIETHYENRMPASAYDPMHRKTKTTHFFPSAIP
jgi:hypothetical protein